MGLHSIFPHLIRLAAEGCVRIFSGNKETNPSHVLAFLCLHKISSSHFAGCEGKLEEMWFLKVGFSWLVVQILSFDREKKHNSDQN